MSPEMEKELYGLPGPDFFHVDDLLDFSNDGLFSSSTVTDSNPHHHLPPPENLNGNRPSAIAADCDDCNRSTSFSDDLCVPTDDIAELEWLSMFVDDSFNDFSVEELAETMSNRPEASVPGRARSKRSRGATTHNIWTSLPQCDTPATGKSKPASNSSNRRKESSPASSVITRDQLSPSSSSSSGPRKCMHCASEKTPQWRTGPLGPKTLCNACGVRYKSGRLVPEYRPAASPTFVLTQHSNSHRKVMELRRQKEMLRQESGSNYQFYQHHHDFKVC